MLDTTFVNNFILLLIGGVIGFLLIFFSNKSLEKKEETILLERTKIKEITDIFLSEKIEKLLALKSDMEKNIILANKAISLFWYAFEVRYIDTLSEFEKPIIDYDKNKKLFVVKERK